MTEIAAEGISIDVPQGWDVQITGSRSAADDASASGVVVHVANFALPAQRGDFGSGAVERMGSDDVLVCLLEYATTDADSSLFSESGIPKVNPGSFARNQMQRTVQGMCGAQFFFNENGRSFCLYIVLGSFIRRASHARAAAKIVESIAIA